MEQIYDLLIELTWICSDINHKCLKDWINGIWLQYGLEKAPARSGPSSQLYD